MREVSWAGCSFSARGVGEECVADGALLPCSLSEGVVYVERLSFCRSLSILTGMLSQRFLWLSESRAGNLWLFFTECILYLQGRHRRRRHCCLQSCSLSICAPVSTLHLSNFYTVDVCVFVYRREMEAPQRAALRNFGSNSLGATENCSRPMMSKAVCVFVYLCTHEQ